MHFGRKQSTSIIIIIVEDQRRVSQPRSAVYTSSPPPSGPCMVRVVYREESPDLRGWKRPRVCSVQREYYLPNGFLSWSLDWDVRQDGGVRLRLRDGRLRRLRLR